MTEIPNLAGVATEELVEKIGGSTFSARYINWSRTVNLLRVHAPGWLPELVLNAQGSVLHRAPVGAYLLIRFRHMDGTVTPEVPQAIMDTKNNSVPLDKIDSRDITDTHRRGVCMAAAFTFGLAYELWAKMPLENGFADNEKATVDPTRKDRSGQPADGVWDSINAADKEAMIAGAAIVKEYADMKDWPGALKYMDGCKFDADHKVAFWTLLPSATRTAIKKETAARKTTLGELS